MHRINIDDLKNKVVMIIIIINNTIMVIKLCLVVCTIIQAVYLASEEKYNSSQGGTEHLSREGFLCQLGQELVSENETSRCL